jgi:flavin reductase (DIM6/NTAB) family NADH-FMN oxidoreductase RutF
MTTVLEQLKLRRVFGAYPTGVAAVAALVSGQPAGIAASSFTPVSLDPPLVSICVARASTTWPWLRRAERLGITVLGAHQSRACRQLSARNRDRFAALSWRATSGGAVILCGASAWLDCSIEREVRAGDHDIVILRVHDLQADPEVLPLVFHRSALGQLAAAGDGRRPYDEQLSRSAC